jgi:hypothetical protein
MIESSAKRAGRSGSTGGCSTNWRPHDRRRVDALCWNRADHEVPMLNVRLGPLR